MIPLIEECDELSRLVAAVGEWSVVQLSIDVPIRDFVRAAMFASMLTPF